jgi:tetratricopeptide (TPR) repeat protein
MRAVKLIFRKEFDDERPYQREFAGLVKFEPISRSHPSQLAILHVGRDEVADCFYYVMELGDPVQNPKTDSKGGARGFEVGLATDPALASAGFYTPRTLRSELKARGHLRASEVIQLGQALATALEHLHGHGLVHRDIKPANIVYVGGVPKLADIGLITDASDACSIVGTEGYIAPEGPGTTAADLYSLGKVLYEAATGRDRRDYPALPDGLLDGQDAKLIMELNEVILRACARDPRNRYSSAAEMRADFEHLQAGNSVRQRYARQRLWGRLKVTGLALGILTGVVMLAAALWRSGAADYEGRPSPVEQANTIFRTGKHHYERMTAADNRIAIQYFEDAVRLDTNFAKAYAWLAVAQCWYYAGTNRSFEFLPQAHVNALRAVFLDRKLAKAHQALGWHAAIADWDWDTAESRFHEAHRLAPKDVESYVWQGFLEACIGRTNEGLAKLAKTLQLQPDSVPARHFYAGALIIARRYDEAITNLTTVAQMEPGGTIATFGKLADAVIAAGRFKEGIATNRLAEILEGKAEADATRSADERLAALIAGGERGYWEHELKEMGTGPYAGVIHARLCHTNQALDLLEAAERVHDWDLLNALSDPGLDGLRNEPKFKALVKRLKVNW